MSTSRPKRAQFNFVLDGELRERFDRIAPPEGPYSRSGLLREALRRMLDELEGRRLIERERRVRAHRRLTETREADR